MRKQLTFDCRGSLCAATLDAGKGDTGLLIVSGGNEIRAGAHAGQAALAAHFASKDYPVFRYDRRGIGDSEGENSGFNGSEDDITAAIAAFRDAVPQLQNIVAFGNCDAATALALFHHGQSLKSLLLANPWVIEEAGSRYAEEAPTSPNAATIRARYWQRIKNPRSIIDLLTGKINLKKLAAGLLKASKKDAPTGLAERMAEAMALSDTPMRILIARRDTTALAFMGAWGDKLFANIRQRANVTIEQFDSASHSFADSKSKDWLYDQISQLLDTK